MRQDNEDFEDQGVDDEHKVRRLQRAKILLCLLTLAYLLIELPFNARLLDVVGGLSSQASIHHIEIFGRVISGFAAALFWWGVATIPGGIKKGRDNPTIFIRMVLIGAALIGSVYAGERQLVHYIVHTSSGAQRRDAVKLNLLSHDIETHKAGLGGIKLNGQLLTSPQGKTFIAYFPFMADHVSNLDAKIKKNMKRLVRNKIQNTIGDAQKFFNKRFRPSIKHINHAFSKYSQMVNKLSKAYSKEHSTARKKWIHYVHHLDQQFGPGPIPRQYDSRIRAHLHAEGINVSNHFPPRDKYNFFKAIYQKIKHRADQHYKAASKKAFGTVLPKNLDSPAKFVNNPRIPKLWRHMIGAGGDHHLHIPYHTHFKQFVKHVYKAVLNYQTQQRLNKIMAQPSSFEDGGSNAKLGRKAVRAEVVPPLALVFSVIGGFTHILKLILMLTAVAAGYIGFRRKPSRLIKQRYVKLAIAAVYVCLVASVYWMPVRITQSPLFGYFEGQMMLTQAKSAHPNAKGSHSSTWQTTVSGVQTDGRIVWADTESVFTRWIIQAQPIVYPDNEWLRTHVLDGFQYGVSNS